MEESKFTEIEAFLFREWAASHGDGEEGQVFGTWIRKEGPNIMVLPRLGRVKVTGTIGLEE